jgi:ABC-type antimicrobial peptide transport system permease subunit
VLSAFGALALLLATSGVFAVMAYTVSRKTRELGIRLALGAHAGQLRRAELWCGARLAGLGLLIGGAGAAWLSRFITGFLHGVGTLDPATYGLVAGIVLGAVLLAGYLPARRAAAVDRVRSLRTE